MRRRYEGDNIPIETLRAFIAVMDNGSYTKAGEYLNLSQPAISARIGRLQRILQGELFIDGPGSRLTHLGETTLNFARRIVGMNDQLIGAAGPRPGPQRLVIGLPRWYEHPRLVEILKRCSEISLPEKLLFRCGGHAEFVPDLNSGIMDIACLCNVAEQPARAIVEWFEPTYWVKSPGLILDPDLPVPLVGWPGSLGERWAAKLLSDAQIPYAVEFTSGDTASRRAAVAAGLGVMVMVAGAMTTEMEIARDAFLPKPPTIRTGIYARSGLNVRRVTPLVSILEDLLKPARTAKLIAIHGRRSSTKL